MVTRKYLSETVLNLYSSSANVIQPTDIYHLSKDVDVRNALEGCNIYLIVRRPRISIAIDSLRVENRGVRGHFLVHTGDGRERFPFSSESEFSQEIVEAQVSDYPQEYVFLINRNNNFIKMPIFRFMAECEYDMNGYDNLEVLYIGQGYGKEGERLSIDRLQDHKTLQRILADTLHRKPDHEILLLLFRYEHHKLHSSTAGDFSVEPTATDEESINYVRESMSAKFSRKNRISLSEAALIRYFEPEYNKIYKNTFPSEKHKILSELLDVDFSGLVVEIDTGSIKTKLYSEKQSADQNLLSRLNPYAHIASIPLYSEEERETFLHAFL